MKFAALIVALASGPSMAEQCLDYRGAVTLRGTLSKHTFPEQPNYESIAKGDAAATYFFISPPLPVCVSAGSVNDNEVPEARIKTIQLVFSHPYGDYRSLRAYLGKQVECKGILYHAISGHHHSPVLLSEAKCHAA